MLKNWLVRKAQAARGEEGFTLIEMSIVLVIIGLLIGGVLKGQELIASTRLKATISQWDAYKSAYNGFVDRFQNIPGDMATATTTVSATGVVNGDGDGVIGTNQTGGNEFTATINADENLNFWAHMAAARLISGVTLGAAAGAATAANAGGIPAGRITGTFWTAENVTTTTGITSDFVALQKGSAAIAASLSGAQYAEIERKFDDSNALTGSILDAAGGTCTTAAGALQPLDQTTSCTPIFNLQ